MLYIFSIKLNLFPSFGRQSLGKEGNVPDLMWHLFLPVTSLAIQQIAGWSRYMRSSMLEVLQQDYVRTAKAKGLPGSRVLYKHALKNALLPVITLLGLSLPSLLAGAAITESIFSWPGLGFLAVQSVTTNDFPVVLAIVMIGGMMVLLGQPAGRRAVRLRRSADQVLRADMERIETTVAPRVGAAAASGGEQDEVDLIPVRTYWQLVRQRFLAHRLAVIALFLMATLVAFAIIVPTVTGDAYKATSLSQSMLPPSLGHPLGTNQIGQDMFLRLMKGLQTSLLIGFMSVAIIGAIGVTLGSISGFYGGRVDNIIMRIVDVVLSLPVFFVILMIVAVLGKGSAAVVIIAIGLTGWTLACRLVRAEFLKLREADFVQAGRALGRVEPADHLPPHPARVAGPGRGRRDARHRRLGGRRSRAVVPRLRDQPARREPRQPAQELRRGSPGPAVAARAAGGDDRPRRPRRQLPRRRPP